ncbi:MAG: hypothetical protein ACREME_04270, partial [Gemmatimonadales bacterium]
MSLLPLLLALQGAQVAPYLAFPDPALDDPAAYEGYSTRLYRDSRGNTVQIYLDAKSGRVVAVWADALNESIGFTTPNAAVAFGASDATVGETDGRRWLRYSLALTAAEREPARLGQFLLGSMRIERDFQYAGRQHDSLDAPPYVVPEMAALAERLDGPYRERLTPRITASRGATRWVIRATQPSLDGQHHLSLTLSGDARRSDATLAARVVTIRPLGPGPVALTVEIATDGPPLHPLTRAAIFNERFRRFA